MVRITKAIGIWTRERDVPILYMYVYTCIYSLCSIIGGVGVGVGVVYTPHSHTDG